MDNNEFSFESIFAAGVGMPVEKTVEVQSEERFDGFLDATFAEISRSEEDIQFLETYGSMEDLNTKAKLNMLSKINKVYGKCNRGIENYCRSLEAETEGTSAVKEDEKPAEEGKTVDPKKVEKKKNWLKSVLSAIGNFFKKIWDAIVNFFKNLSVRVKTFITKVQTKSNINKEKKATDKAQKKGEVVETPMTKEDAEKLSKFVDETYRNIIKVQSFVNKISAKNDELIKIIDNTTNNTSDFYKLISLSSSLLKNLSTIGNVILTSSTKIFTNITNVRVNGSNDISKFVNTFGTLCNNTINLYDVIKKAKDKNEIEPLPLDRLVSGIYNALRNTTLHIIDNIKLPSLTNSTMDEKLKVFAEFKSVIDEKINAIKENDPNVIKDVGEMLYGIKFINDKAFEKKPESK